MLDSAHIGHDQRKLLVCDFFHRTEVEVLDTLMLIRLFHLFDLGAFSSQSQTERCSTCFRKAVDVRMYSAADHTLVWVTGRSPLLFSVRCTLLLESTPHRTSRAPSDTVSTFTSYHTWRFIFTVTTFIMSHTFILSL